MTGMTFQELVDLLFDVQTGHTSCRYAAKRIMESFGEKEEEDNGNRK